MPITFDAMPTSQPLGTFYTAVIPAADLLSMCAFDYRRLNNTVGDAEFMGIQRPYSSKRVKEIADYTDTVDACFPTSIVISIDERCVTSKVLANGMSRITVDSYVGDDEEGSVDLSKAAFIVDGQHRLKGLEANNRHLFEMPTTVFVGADEATRAALFSIVNLAQTKVNRSIVYDLFAVASERSPQKTCHNITVSLDKLESSPFYKRIKRLGAATDGRLGETLSQATVVRGIMQYVSADPAVDQDRSKRGLPIEVYGGHAGDKLILRPFYVRKDDDAILDLVLNYFGAVRERWGMAWDNDGRGNMINRTNGFDGFMKFFRVVYGNITSSPKVITQAEFYEVFRDVQLTDRDFNVRRFAPGSTGASDLYKALRAQTGL